MTASESQWWQTFFDDAYVEAWAADGAFEWTGQMADQLIDLVDLPEGARLLGIPSWTPRGMASICARHRGCHLIQLTTNKEREDAHRFYESLGFQATHEGMKLYLDGAVTGRYRAGE